VDGEPMQKVIPDERFLMRVVDLSEYEEALRNEQVRLQKAAEIAEKFDLQRGPLIRGRQLRLGVEDHVLLITMHHIASDGWSKTVFINEIAALYRDYCQERGNQLSALPIQYADYARWQREWLRGEPYDRQMNYWCQQLRGAAPQLELPTDRPRPAAQSHRGETIKFELDPHLSAQLKAFAQQHEMTLFMVLYAAWAILLSRLSGQTDILVGTPVANRQRPELEGLIGFFVNTLVLRIGVRDDLRLQELLDQARKVALSAFDHQDVPFERVVEALHPERSLSRNPLFQVMFSVQNAPKTELDLPNLTGILEDDAEESSMFDLLLLLEEQGNRIVGRVNYATDLFDRGTVQRWMECFVQLLTGMEDRTQWHVSDLPILPKEQRREVVELFNATQVTYPSQTLLHEAFEVQAVRTPDAAAVVCGQQSST
jgi:hypothetical protein